MRRHTTWLIAAACLVGGILLGVSDAGRGAVQRVSDTWRLAMVKVEYAQAGPRAPASKLDALRSRADELRARGASEAAARAVARAWAWRWRALGAASLALAFAPLTGFRIAHLVHSLDLWQASSETLKP